MEDSNGNKQPQLSFNERRIAIVLPERLMLRLHHFYDGRGQKQFLVKSLVKEHLDMLEKAEMEGQLLHRILIRDD